MAPAKTNLPWNINGETVLIAIKDQVSANLEDEAVILHLKDGVYYGLNPVGARIWNLLQEARSVNQLRDILLSEYEVEPRRLEEDLLQLLQELASRGLIEVHYDTTG
jgi:hypothetical protein